MKRPPRHNFNRCHECTTDDLRIDLDELLNARRKRIHRVELVQSIAPMALTLGNPPLAANLRSDVGLISCIVRESGLPARHVDDSVPRSWGWWNSGWTGTALISLPAPFRKLPDAASFICGSNKGCCLARGSNRPALENLKSAIDVYQSIMMVYRCIRLVFQ